MATIPDKPTLDGIEDGWAERWEAEGTYRFDRDRATAGDRGAVFSVDTPPPTVSGSIHMGTVFGYTQTDAITRYQRMAGKAVFFPIGWDDNGLATERRVQNYYGVRCDPTQQYVAGYQPPFRGDAPKDHREVPISRPNFVELCLELTATDEAVFEALFRRLGLSYDWALKYETVNDISRRTSQQAFLRNLARGEAYSTEAPTVWDVDDQTAVAQAEIEDRERPGAYHTIAFHGPDGPVLIDTTRPELLVSCVALVAHPDDERYAPLVGRTVRTPIFGVEVPVVVHPLAETDKGTGIAMVCTFGDTTDVTWWRELDLPTRNVIRRDGRFTTETPEWLTGEGAVAAYGKLGGATVKQAQKATAELLAASGDLRGEPRPITHPVKFYERGSRPLEIVTSRQWYVRNGGRDQPRREAFLARGRELAWHPGHMRHRYDHWVEGLNGDWLISRQRFFGVPIPLWYPVGGDGEADWDAPITPDETTLPIDPSSDVPPGYAADQRGVPGGFVGDPDIMDTWATSSLTPQIAAHWVDDPELFAAVFPMDIRPQGPEIIRTWLFSTVVRAHYEHDSLPWAATTINGWILDPDRKKMSKSKGNVVTPMALFDKYGTDAVRYWAISARPGVDTAFSEDQMKVGRRLATKLLNVTKFVLSIHNAAAEAPGGAGVPDPDPTSARRDRPHNAAAEAPGGAGVPDPDPTSARRDRPHNAAAEAPGGAGVPDPDPTSARRDRPHNAAAEAPGGAAVPDPDPTSARRDRPHNAAAEAPGGAGVPAQVVTDPVDQAMLARLDAVIADATRAYETYDYARALERTETFFWWFCDDYVELVKGRAYGGRGSEPAASARAALMHALDALTRLLAPTLPFATEEAWRWWHDGSVHVASWPAARHGGSDESGLELDAVSEVLARARRAKTEAKVSQRAAVERLAVTTPSPSAAAAVEAARADLVDALTATELDVATGDGWTVETVLAPPAA